MTYHSLDLDDAVEEVVVPDAVDISWGNITQKFSEPLLVDSECEFWLDNDFLIVVNFWN